MKTLLFVLIFGLIVLLLSYKKENIMHYVSAPSGCLVRHASGQVRCSNDKHYKCDDAIKCYPYKCLNNYSGLVTWRNEPCWQDEIYNIGVILNSHQK